MTNLKWLALSGNDIVDISALSALTNLTYLSLSANDIVDISALSGLTKLTELNLNENPLSASSINDHIPALQDRGVTVEFDPTPVTITDDPTPVTIRDAKLRAAIAAALGKASGATITKGEMTTLFRLDAENAGIRDLAGLEFATNLTSLDLFYNNISDISALAGLTNLTLLNLIGNNITDISPLSGLTNLTWLQLLGNNITDVSPLSGLTNLGLLTFGDTEITDISALSGLTNLTLLEIPLNNITDISALSGLTNLTWLSLWGNNITDISPLGGLTNLNSLVLSNNNITDILALSGLTNLTWLELGDLDLMDISPLGGLTNLNSLVLSNNNITDISALSGLTNLERLELGENSIEDISALSGLTNLEYLNLNFSNISDISALSGLTSLTHLDLRGNPLSDTSINEHIPVLESNGATVRFDAFGNSDFDIELVFTDAFTDNQKNVLQYVARRWMAVITGDLPDYEFTQGWKGTCGDHSYEIPSGERIDDLRIYMTTFDDNPDAVGWGGPSLLREETYLPVLGCIAFDLKRANLLITGLHETGHVLGFGTVWDNLGFYQNPPDGDQHFNGPLAIAAFDEAGGRNYTGVKVPLNDPGHWRVPVLSGELMGPGGGGALSAITVQSLADLGYGVDATQADPYVLPGAAGKASAKIAVSAPSILGDDRTWQFEGAERILGRRVSFDLPDNQRTLGGGSPSHAEPDLTCGAAQMNEPIYVVDPRGHIVRTINR